MLVFSFSLAYKPPHLSIATLHYEKYLTLSPENNSPSSYAGVNGE